jgi:hypothetical protein
MKLGEVKKGLQEAGDEDRRQGAGPEERRHCTGGTQSWRMVLASGQPMLVASCIWTNAAASILCRPQPGTQLVSALSTLTVRREHPGGRQTVSALDVSRLGAVECDTACDSQSGLRRPSPAHRVPPRHLNQPAQNCTQPFKAETSTWRLYVSKNLPFEAMHTASDPTQPAGLVKPCLDRQAGYCKPTIPADQDGHDQNGRGAFTDAALCIRLPGAGRLQRSRSASSLAGSPHS